jgi:DNA-binding NarL/FixJ family response regulator
LKILVVDDHALVREGLSQVLKGMDEKVEVLSASTCARAFELADEHTDLDLVLLDYHLPDMSGVDALCVLGKTHPELPVVILSGTLDSQIVKRVIAKGAAGFITKSSDSDELLLALQLVLAGEVYEPHHLYPVPVTLLPKTPARPSQLTRRQEDVLYLLLDGRSNKEISQILCLADETTKSHISGILRAFGVQSRIQAVLVATDYGYLKRELSL